MPRGRTSAEVVGLTLLAATEAPNFLAGMLPSLMTIGRFAAEEEDRRRLRHGELIGSALTMTVAAGASLVADSWLPFLAAGGVLAVMLWFYEDAIRNPSSDAKPINQQGVAAGASGA